MIRRSNATGTTFEWCTRWKHAHYLRVQWHTLTKNGGPIAQRGSLAVDQEVGEAKQNEERSRASVLLRAAGPSCTLTVLYNRCPPALWTTRSLPDHEQGGCQGLGWRNEETGRQELGSQQLLEARWPLRFLSPSEVKAFFPRFVGMIEQ